VKILINHHTVASVIVSTMTKLCDGRPGFDSRQEQRKVSLFFATASRPTQWLGEGGSSSRGQAAGALLTTHLQLVPKLRTSAAIQPLPPPPIQLVGVVFNLVQVVFTGGCVGVRRDNFMFLPFPLPSCIVKFKNIWSFSSTHACTFTAWCLSTGKN
jgi:hypothetical protein